MSFFCQFHQKFLLPFQLCFVSFEFFYYYSALICPAKKPASCTGISICCQPVLLQYTESVIIQIKIPLLFLYLLSYVPRHAEMQKKTAAVLPHMQPQQPQICQMSDINFSFVLSSGTSRTCSRSRFRISPSSGPGLYPAWIRSLPVTASVLRETH